MKDQFIFAGIYVQKNISFHSDPLRQTQQSMGELFDANGNNIGFTGFLNKSLLYEFYIKFYHLKSASKLYNTTITGIWQHKKRN